MAWLGDKRLIEGLKPPPLVIDDAVLAKKYADNWQKHLAHSEKYEGKGN